MMMKRFKKQLIIVCVILVLIGAISTYWNISRQRAIVEEQEEHIRRTYWRVNSSFGWDQRWQFIEGWDWNSLGTYMPLTVGDSEFFTCIYYNEFSLCIYIYILLILYERETGTMLPYEVVANYFSEEFEPDGSLRLYNNGRHPEMQAYVEWSRSGQRLGNPIEYLNHLINLYHEYVYLHKDLGFIEQHVTALSPQMLDALARAEADPDYVLDLTSLQRAGY